MESDFVVVVIPLVKKLRDVHPIIKRSTKDSKKIFVKAASRESDLINSAHHFLKILIRET
jgi:hypothetical protein